MPSRTRIRAIPVPIPDVLRLLPRGLPRKLSTRRPSCPSCLRDESSPNSASRPDSSPTGTPQWRHLSRGPIDAPHVPQSITDLPERSPRPDRVEDGGHERGSAGRGGAEGGEDVGDTRLVAAATGLGQARALLGLEGRKVGG